MGVAISTTGDEHRMKFLETSVWHWRRALPLGSVIVVTVDGSQDDAVRTLTVVDRPDSYVGGNTYRVGQPTEPQPDMIRDGRLGVAVNKNTGLELLMDAGVEHLFLCDDDTWPLYAQSLTKHTDLAETLPHSMACWGNHRLSGVTRQAATWTWPRGVMLYAHHTVVETVGGMDERFGPGGHEHVEWSNRIHNAGLTPAPYCSPPSYGTRNGTGVRALWHAEDMVRPGEKLGDHRLRRRNLTSVRRTDDDWVHIDKIMSEREGSSDFVPFRAHENGRASATLCQNLTCAVEPAEPRSQE